MKQGFVRSAIEQLVQLPQAAHIYDEIRAARIANLGRATYPRNQVGQALFICYALGIPAKQLPYVWRLIRTFLYRRQVAPSSHVFEYLYVRSHIPKKRGGIRVIDAPKGELKKLQRSLLGALNFALESVYKQTGNIGVHGFRQEKSNISAALDHVGRPCVVKLDVRDFFPSITYDGVLTAMDWVASRSGIADFGWLLKSLLAELLTVEGRLPAGAPTSPVLSNLFMLGFDQHMQKTCAQREVAYTRYADDITLSGSSEATRQLIGIVKEELQKRGLELHPEKVNVQRKGRRQKVCGIVVNDKPSIGRELRKKLRAAKHRADQGHPPFLNGKVLSPPQLAGHLAYASAVSTAAIPWA